MTADTTRRPLTRRQSLVMAAAAAATTVAGEAEAGDVTVLSRVRIEPDSTDPTSVGINGFGLSDVPRPALLTALGSAIIKISISSTEQSKFKAAPNDYLRDNVKLPGNAKPPKWDDMLSTVTINPVIEQKGFWTIVIPELNSTMAATPDPKYAETLGYVAIMGCKN